LNQRCFPEADAENVQKEVTPEVIKTTISTPIFFMVAPSKQLYNVRVFQFFQYSEIVQKLKKPFKQPSEE